MHSRLRWGLTVLVSAAVGAFVATAYHRGSQTPTGTEEPGAFVAQTLGNPGEGGRFSSEEFADSLRDPRMSMRELRKTGEAAVLRDPVAAVRSAREIPGYDNRETYLASVLTAWGEQDGASAVLWITDNFKGTQLSDALYYVADGWADADPAAAGAWYLARTEGSVRVDSLWEVMEAWGRKDPQAAAIWSETLEDDLKWQVIDGLGDGWAAVDPKGAAAFAEKMIEADSGGDFIRAVATQWAAYDPAEAVKWAAKLQQEAAAEMVHVEIGEIWASTDPLAAAKWVDAQADPGRARWSREGVARGWAAHDPGGALDWVLAERSGVTPEEGLVEDVVKQWSEVAPGSVSEWLDARGSKPGNDPVLRHFSSSILEIDPQAAMVWAGEITDPGARKQQLYELADEWLSLEGAAAIPKIEALGLSIDMKELLGE